MTAVDLFHGIGRREESNSRHGGRGGRVGLGGDDVRTDGGVRPAWSFTHGGISHPIYSTGNGPPVVVLHELPGMMPECIDLGLILAQRFRVHLPPLFGKPGEFAMAKNIARLCVSREIHAFAGHRTVRGVIRITPRSISACAPVLSHAWVCAQRHVRSIAAELERPPNYGESAARHLT
jgi:hypothetical protein